MYTFSREQIVHLKSLKDKKFEVPVEVEVISEENRLITFAPAIEIDGEYYSSASVENTVEYAEINEAKTLKSAHYNKNTYETIDVIKDVVSSYEDPFVSFCIGNVLKYVSRAPHKHKNLSDDLLKAKDYLEYVLEHISSAKTR